MEHRVDFTSRGYFVAGLGTLALLTLIGGCDPNQIGLQDYGTIVGRVADQDGKPIQGALVRSTGTTYTFTTDKTGAFAIQKVAVGQQTVTAYGPGYAGNATTDVIVTKDQTVQAGDLHLQAISAPST
jgi:hypothetical protein